MKRRVFLVIIAALLLVPLVWTLAFKSLVPVLDGYEVVEQPLVQTVVATGRVTNVSRAQLGSPVTGVVVERRVREGDLVKPGDVLAVLRADDLEAAVREARAALAQLQQSTLPQAQAALYEAQAQAAQASREVQRRRELFEQQAISREEMERAVQADIAARAVAEQARLNFLSLTAGNPNEAAARARLASAQAQLAKTIIRAEVAGTVLTRNAEPGDLVQPGRVLFEIARDGDTEVRVPLDEKNLEVLAIGQPAACIADAYPSQPFQARVSFIAPSVDSQRGTVDVRLAIDAAPAFLRQDMTVTVNIETGRRDRAMVVPNDALIADEGRRAHIWVVDDGRIALRQIELGLRGMAKTEITAGLRPGDRVLADGKAVVEEDERVRLRMAPQDRYPSAKDSSTRRETPARLN